ncbi:MAG TPA: ClpXP protease specificity-enhancing factor [Burkholderiales bacterium]|nr:ClpXP protease specificity-enhancing factor [Burkholderiales bacterium]
MHRRRVYTDATLSEPTTTKPYLMRALYEWCVDNGYTPYVSVIVDAQTRVPLEYVRNGEIVLNIGPLAANKLKLGNEYVEFSARFGGVAKELFIPVSQVSAIYARENGHGMSFEIEASKPQSEEKPVQLEAAPTDLAPPTEPPSTSPQGGGKPSLRVIK